MLSKEENELLTRTDPGTPMGELVRRYWIPALLSEEILEPDSPPVQVRTLGEELVAFRDSQGKIGLLDEHCSHRGTSLFYGRNEECGLRCIYHGWKYDVDGNVLDTPAEPADSDFRKKIRHLAYPTVELAGIVFAYLGPREKRPLFPQYEWTLVPQNQTYVTKSLLECNYLQGLEGECDSSHLSILHREFKRDDLQSLFHQDAAPVYEVEETDFGMRLVALRQAGPDQTYVRVSSFVMPVSCWVPALNKEIHLYVPIDDTHAWRYDLGFRTDRPVSPEEVRRRKVIGPDYSRSRGLDNHYKQDRTAQKTVNFTGITGDGIEADFLGHDACATESMGTIYDRGTEHLGVSDKAVIAVRRYLISTIRRFQEGKEPPHIVRDPEQNRFPHVDTLTKVIPAGGDWRQHFPHLRGPVSARKSPHEIDTKRP